MAKRAEAQPRSSSERQSKGQLDQLTARANSEAIEDTVDGEAKGGELPDIDEIRLRAYYRYLERENGNADEIADWLAAESELRGPADAGRAGDPGGGES